MGAGQYKHRIVIQAPSTSVDAFGATVGGFVEYARVWANIRHVSGIESIKGDSIASNVKASIRIRYRPDIKASMRVVFGSDVYEIMAVLPDLAHKKHVDLSCSRID